MTATCLLSIALIAFALSPTANGGVVDRTKPGSSVVDISVESQPDGWIEDEIPYDNCFAPTLYRSYEGKSVGVSCEALTTAAVKLGPFPVRRSKGKDSTLPAFRTRTAKPAFDVDAALRQARAVVGAPIAVQPITSAVKAWEGEATIVRVSILTQENVASVGLSLPDQDGLTAVSVPVDGRALVTRGRLEGVDLQRIAVAHVAITPLRTGELTLSGVRLFVRHWSPERLGLRPGFSGPPKGDLLSQVTLEVPPVPITVEAPAAPVTRSPRTNLRCEASSAVPGLPVWVRVETYLHGRAVPMPEPTVDGGVVESSSFNWSGEADRAHLIWLLRFDPADTPRKIPEISMRTWNSQTGMQVASCTPEASVPALLPPDIAAVKDGGAREWLTPYIVRLGWSLSTLASGLLLVCVAALASARRLSRRRS